MKTESNVNLAQYTTFRMGGTAETLYTPESPEELKSLLDRIPRPWYSVGGGSNLLINDRKTFPHVINLREFSRDIIPRGEGKYRVGASVRLQQLITAINQEGYGGIEYLYSVPGLVGGAVYMNAGRGEKFHQCISDYILSVEVLQDGERKTLSKQECGFAHRRSVFQSEEMFILSVEFAFKEVAPDEAKRQREERIALCREKQDTSKPNYGTVFCVADRKIMKLFCHPLLGKKGGVRFSGKSPNWMLNAEKGSFRDAVVLLKRVERLHKLLHKKCRREVIIWE